MNNIYFYTGLLALFGGIPLSGHTENFPADTVCEFTHTGFIAPCQFVLNNTQATAALSMGQNAYQEQVITHITITAAGLSQNLPVSADTTLHEQATGIVFMPDINADGHPDLALMTSYGTPNSYYDYWLFLPRTGKFQFTGNFPKLEKSAEGNYWQADVKLDAVHTEKQCFYWQSEVFIRRACNAGR